MRQLILIKHARPLVEQDKPSHEWELSQDGRRHCGQLAARLHPLAPSAIISSEEPKALQTARIIADALGRPVETDPGLAEHDRGNVPMMASSEFISLMALFFRDRGRLVLGRETANQARKRITASVDEILLRHPEGNVAVVTHGAVLALLLADRAQIDPFQNWRRMALPSFATFAVPQWNLEQIVERVE